MLYDSLKWIFLFHFVLSSLKQCYSYNVEMTIQDHEKGKTVSQFEIVSHDNPPFGLEYTSQLYKGDIDSYLRDNSVTDAYLLASEVGMHDVNGDIMMSDGVKVSGFLGNVRRKRSLDQVSNECIKRQGESNTSNKVVTVERGETIHLPCHSCVEYANEAFQSMEWIKLYQYPNSQGLYHIKEVLPDTHDEEKLNRVSVTLDHTLVIKKAKLSDAGSYFCKPSDKSAFFANLRLDWRELQEFITTEVHMKYFFHVDVIDLNHAYTIDVSSYSNTKPVKPEVLYDLNVEIGTTWHPWTSCSVCGDEGIRKRMGICFVRKHDSGKIVPHHYLRYVLEFAKDGVPCQSEFLREFRGEHWLKRPNQIQTEACSTPCKTSKSKRVKRGVNILSRNEVKDDNVKEVIDENNETIKVKKKSVTVGSYLILKCPGISLTETVNWVNGSELVHLMEIQKMSNSRISFDMFGNLHFKAAEITDSGTYSCWLGKKIKRKYHVTVKEDVNSEIIEYTIYLSLSFVVDFVAFVALAVVKFLHRKVQNRKRKQEKELADESVEHSGDEEDADDEISSSETESSD